MGQYQNQKESRTELQQRIAAELRAKAAQNSKISDNSHDGVDDSTYIEGTKKTTSLAWVWLLIFFMAIATFVYFVYKANS